MKRFTQFMLAVCVAATASACAGDHRADNSKPADPGAVGTAGTPAATPEPARNDAGRGDSNFVRDMMVDGQKEVDLGKLAQQKAQNAKVKAFAAMLVRDHTKAGTELKSLASDAHINLAEAHDDMADTQADHDRFAKYTGAEFDREYIKAMVDDHEKAVKDTQDKADGADNPQVKQWAAKTLPVLKKHLEQAKQLQDTLEKRSGN